ncbi:hypothetical protein [Kineosporia babensis]|uniref:Uncharacterized protein n=1 Tax=Kineosporia babensis TaxID=499548 RepID=A0A9X1NAT8_9ACTN|nr:hypothetical protein [Kineosporia babensis]MCD5310700.1 hypothetical protein [Kineosporia babensis]
MTTTSQPYADLTDLPSTEGQLVQAANDPNVYFILDGLLRLVPDSTTQANLFGPTPTIQQNFDITSLPIGVPITSGAVLAGAPSYGVCLFTESVRRHVLGGNMPIYGFVWPTTLATLPDILFESVSGGPDIGVPVPTP